MSKLRKVLSKLGLATTFKFKKIYNYNILSKKLETIAKKTLEIEKYVNVTDDKAVIYL